MKRFVKPELFAPEQQQALENTLAKLRIGDDEGRKLFIRALSYALAEYDEKQDELQEQESEKPTSPLEDIAATATSLATRLEQLSIPDAAKLSLHLSQMDPFNRGYDSAYLDAIGYELTRIASASKNQALTALNSADREFLDLVEETYRECFEIEGKLETKYDELLAGIISIFELSPMLTRAER